MWLVISNSPHTSKLAKPHKWTFEHARVRASHSNKTVDDRLWWTFRSKSIALDAMSVLRRENKGYFLRLTLKKIERIPDGWQ